MIRIIEEFNGKEQSIDSLIDVSFLRDGTKEFYKQNYKDKLTRLKIVYPKPNSITHK